ncbi:hypothetical protein GCM10027341_33130 [Spirosoma knui]
MKTPESYLEKQFAEKFSSYNVRLKTSIAEHKLRILRPDSFPIGFDFILRAGYRTIAIIEIKSKNFFENFNFARLIKYANENDIRYAILSDGINKFKILDRNKENNFIDTDFDGFIQIISQRKIYDFIEINQSIASIITAVINESEFTYLKECISNNAINIATLVNYEEIDEVFYLSDPQNIDSLENKIFRLLLKDDKVPSKVFRYTTLPTLYAMLKNNTFRMNCLVGMNDTTEVNYAENYILGTSRSYSQADEKTIEAYNNRFISSCSLKQDDLTQWRLYADDSKGVCLEFNSSIEALKKNEFILKRISYSKKDQSHPELDLIKEITNRIKTDLNINFEFKTLSIWRHFFKPYEYEVEKEVRLLYIAEYNSKIKKGWNLTSSHQILNPFVEFDLKDNSLPIELIGVVFGPKCSEKDINKKQFEQFVRELISGGYTNLKDLKFTISKISNYR